MIKPCDTPPVSVMVVVSHNTSDGRRALLLPLPSCWLLGVAGLFFGLRIAETYQVVAVLDSANHGVGVLGQVTQLLFQSGQVSR